MIKFVFIIYLLCITTVQATDKWKYNYFKFSIGAEYLSNLNKRGATFYDSYQVIPIFSIDLFSKDLFIVGTSLNYRHKINNYLLYRAKLNINATGDKPLYKTGLEINKLDQKAKTNEIDNILEIRSKKQGEISLLISKDLQAHNGSYLELKIRKIAFNQKVGKLNFQTALFTSIGAGTKAHNKYLYGEGSSAFSLTNYSYGLSISAPPAIDYIYPVLNIKRYGILGSKNKNASLVRDNNSNWQIIALFAFNIF